VHQVFKTDAAGIGQGRDAARLSSRARLLDSREAADPDKRKCARRAQAPCERRLEGRTSRAICERGGLGDETERTIRAPILPLRGEASSGDATAHLPVSSSIPLIGGRAFSNMILRIRF
jgi:hypothetical protein